ncbi:methylated-DNA--[protein]-cysteine S-methyltransferase [Sneathiella chungangensis]|uniref:Methylated-DNA--protein-cysteine methyltransferase n=1 Tax=Sneathiella chungangensis TaxID=1418234 RepID=A0A845MJP8_9PROT|nr:methylated-DNA--[protein]-cysteine S-methyltransferase [Sneathiella chungangensis]MZR24069.1 methylated-DNA--[protein]-cysteine S-methyltransferase [Sneathiella chungangensis]
MALLSLHSPVGDLTVTEEDGKIISLDWGWVPKEWQSSTPLLEDAINQLNRYFDGEIGDFDLPLAPPGTEFQKKVWAEMLKIPAGKTKSYGEIAKILGSAAQPVGTACGANPIPIIIPCHRILAAGGKMGGYSGDGGLETKKALLRLENALPMDQQLLDI